MPLPKNSLSYDAGIYEIDTLIEGNSILSTVFISAMAPASSLLVEYYDAQTGELEGEYYFLTAHPLLTIPQITNRKTVTRIHNRPKCKITIVGQVRFSVYITVIQSSASDLDASLHFEGDTVLLDRDKGLPISLFDPIQNTWVFPRSIDGRLLVSMQQPLQLTINKILTGESLISLPATPYTHIDYDVPVNKRLYFLGAKGYSDSWANWELFINDTLILQKRNNQITPDIDIKLPSIYTLTAGDNIKIKATNVNYYLENSIIKTYLYGHEETV